MGTTEVCVPPCGRQACKPGTTRCPHSPLGKGAAAATQPVSHHADRARWLFEPSFLDDMDVPPSCPSLPSVRVCEFNTARANVQEVRLELGRTLTLKFVILAVSFTRIVQCNVACLSSCVARTY